MEQGYVRSDDLMELEFITDNMIEKHYHGDYEILYVISGRVRIFLSDDAEQVLNPGDFLLINPNWYHSYRGSDQLLMGRFVMSYHRVRQLTALDNPYFILNSAKGPEDTISQVRILIDRLFNQYISRRQEVAYYISLQYQLLHLLAKYFLLTKKDVTFENSGTDSDDRLADIFSYIRSNYRENIRLQDLSDHLYLSPTYVSKYIRKKCGISFVELVNSVRLGHAIENLIHTDIPILKIAMDNGFASIAAFNRCFKEAQKMTPSEFRRQVQGKERKEEDVKQEELIQERVEDYLMTRPTDFEEIIESRRSITAEFGAPAYLMDKHACLRMINVGTAVNLTNSEYQEQIVKMKEKLGFEYVRFWDIFDPELFIDIHESKENINFRRLNAAFDFLVKNNLKPYVGLQFKPFRLLFNTQFAVREVDRHDEFASDDELKSFFSVFMQHLTRRYGLAEVGSWYFEYSEKEHMTFDNTKMVFSLKKGTQEKFERYFHKFDLVAEAFSDYLPEVRLGGGGFPIRHYDRDVFTQILRDWKKHPYQPSFLTITAFPYFLEYENGSYFERKSTEVSFVTQYLNRTRELTEKADFSTREIHVVEFNISLSSRNVLNDSCYKAAYLLQNAALCLKEQNFIAHWVLSDLYSDYWDTRDILFGGSGLMTRDGIPKPAFFAFQFLNELYKNVLLADKNCIITTNERNSFRVVCNNMKTLKHTYHMIEENDIHIRDIPSMMENMEYLTLHLTLTNIPNGVYIVKCRQVSSDDGSIQNEWEDLNRRSHLNVDELEYLDQITVPKLSFKEIIIEKNCLETDIILQPNEIQHLYITKE